jgi:hypothetical protein
VVCVYTYVFINSSNAYRSQFGVLFLSSSLGTSAGVSSTCGIILKVDGVVASYTVLHDICNT